MKSYSYKKSREEQNQQTNLWDAFINHLENTYFPGAYNALEAQLIAFEYDSFKSCYSA